MIWGGRAFERATVPSGSDGAAPSRDLVPARELFAHSAWQPATGGSASRNRERAFRVVRSGWISLRMRLARWAPDLALVLLVLWGLFIVYGTTLPFEFSASSDVIQAPLRRFCDHPLRGGSWHGAAVTDWASR